MVVGRDEALELRFQLARAEHLELQFNASILTQALGNALHGEAFDQETSAIAPHVQGDLAALEAVSALRQLLLEGTEHLCFPSRVLRGQVLKPRRTCLLYTSDAADDM
eukprot:12273189-Alexandrium_andersonii.AAC.1